MIYVHWTESGFLHNNQEDGILRRGVNAGHKGKCGKTKSLWPKSI